MIAHRKRTISLIQISNIIRTRCGYEIEIPNKIKTSKRGAFHPLLVLPEFLEKPELCVVKTLNKYLEIIKGIRNDCEDLFLTATNPHKKHK